jgi:hypothetical protein
VNEQDKDSDARNMEELGDVYKQTFDNIPAWGLFAALGMFVGAVYYRGNPVWQAVLTGAGFALIAYLESPYARRRRALRIIRKRAAIELALLALRQSRGSQSGSLPVVFTRSVCGFGSTRQATPQAQCSASCSAVYSWLGRRPCGSRRCGAGRLSGLCGFIAFTKRG